MQNTIFEPVNVKPGVFLSIFPNVNININFCAICVFKMFLKSDFKNIFSDIRFLD